MIDTARQSREELGRAKMLKEIASGKLTPLKAIKLHCLDCVCYDRNEVTKCGNVDCPLHEFRFGRNPRHKGRVDRKGKEVGE